MTQPTAGDVHVDAALTNVSIAYVQSADHFIADRVFPTLPVQKQSDVYFQYDKGDFFRNVAQLRADATESAGGGYKMTNTQYFAPVYAFHKDVGYQTKANADPAVDPERDATVFTSQVLMIKRENIWVANNFTTGVWGTDFTPGALWDDDANSDPISDIENAKQTILSNTGFEPNKLTLGYPVFKALKKHPLIIDRYKYTSSESITPALLAALFEVEEVLVAKAVQNTANEGATNALSFIAGKNALLSYAPSTPALLTPSAGYTFAWSGLTGLNNKGIRTMNIPMNWLGAGTVRIETEMAFVPKVVASDLGYFFSAAVS